VEAALVVREPLIVFREGSSALAAVARAATAAALPSARPPPPHHLDAVPSAVRDRVGLEAKFSLRGGLDGVPVLGRALEALPGAALEQTLFLSVDALASLFGRRGVHAVSEYALGWEGFARPLGAPLPWRLERGDTLEAVRLRVETLAGPRILISEVLPAPAGDDTRLEFVELYNPGWAEEDLSGWQIRDAGGRAFRIPDGTRIPPNGALLLARSSADFYRAFGAAPDVPTLTLALNDAGDRIVLLNARGWTSDEAAWGPYAPLSPAAPEGMSLSRIEAAIPPLETPGSALRYTGAASDFALGAPTPGALP
jgi:hypothetical protein